MIDFNTLEQTSVDILHSSFVEAFSDYQVEIDLPLEKLGSMLRRRGYTPELSIGAFEGEKLVGFVLNGLRSWGGQPTLYDCGTGVVPEYRQRGITKKAFNEVLALAQKNGLHQYLLEVIQSNTPAVELYRKQGFHTTRSLACFQIDKSSIPAKPRSAASFERRAIENLDWPLLKSFWDFEPSWQNSIASVTAVAGSFEAIIARLGDAVAGYGIIETGSGDIPQLAVRIDYRRQGVAAGLLHELAKYTTSDDLVLLNIDAAYPGMNAFLQALGFEHFIDQYEMFLS